MLNYIWLTLIILGVGSALYIDLSDISSNKYHNNQPVPVTIESSSSINTDSNAVYDCIARLKSQDYNRLFNKSLVNDLLIPATISINSSEKKASIVLKLDDSAPALLRKRAEESGNKSELGAEIRFFDTSNNNTITALLIFEPISFLMMKNVTNEVIDMVETAVTISLGLIGIMALWLGVMKVAEDAGLIAKLANAIKPITKRLFPEIPSDHPAIGAMLMNISANMLGLGNAATPFGLKAMDDLDKLNPEKGTATNSMVTFLAINTAGLTLIPATAIAVRAAQGSADPTIVIGTSIFGASCATLTGIIAAKLLEKFPIKTGEFKEWLSENWKLPATILFLLFFFLIGSSTGLLKYIGSLFSFIKPELFKEVIKILSTIAIPFLILVFIGYGAIKKVKVYEQFVEGAKDGFNIAIKIIPYLVAMLAAIGIFRAGGAMDNLLIPVMRVFTDLIGMPPEALPMALIRPLSGSGSLGVMAETMKVHGPDSFIGVLVSTFFGSTETTFYVLAVYFGAVNIRRTRHAVAVGLLADVAGILGALFIVKMMFS